MDKNSERMQKLFLSVAADCPQLNFFQTSLIVWNESIDEAHIWAVGKYK